MDGRAVPPAGVPGPAYEAGGGDGAISRDGGETWQAADEDRDRHYTWSVTVDPVTGLLIEKTFTK